MSRKTRLFALIVAAIMLGVLILGIVMSAGAGAESSAELEQLRREAEALSQRRQELQQSLEDAQQRRASAIERKTTLDDQIQTTSAEVRVIESIIESLDGQIVDNTLQLDAALLDEADQDELFRARVRAMEETGDTRYLDVLLGGESYSDLLSRMGTIQEIMEYDQQVLARMKATQEAIREARAALDRDLAEQRTAAGELAVRQADLSDRLSEQVRMIQELEEEEAAYNQAMDETEAAEAQLHTQIDDLLAAIERQAEAEQRPHDFVGGQYNWPLPGYTHISSYFGPRTHPVFGGTRSHNGLDIPAPRGTPIHAANAGTVILATYNGGYGNCVTIDHGGGQTTTYGHMSQISVSAGEAVSAGDVVGLVGSTGVSTGNHLHFEMRSNGSLVNPLDYVRP